MGEATTSVPLGEDRYCSRRLEQRFEQDLFMGYSRATGGVLREFLEKYGKVLDPDKEVKRLGQMHKESAKAIVEDYELPMTAEEYSLAVMPIYQQRFPQTQVGRNCFLLSLVVMKLVMENLLQTCSHLTGVESNMFRFLEAARRLGFDASSCLVIEDSPVGVRAAKDAGTTVVAVPSLQNQAERYSIANYVLRSLLEFQPELWGLPPFEDWIQNALPIEPLYAKGLIREAVAQNSSVILSIDSDNGSYDTLPDQISGIFFGWAKLQIQGIFKMVAAKPFILGEINNFIMEPLQLVFVGYVRKLFDEETVLDADIPTKEDASIAWNALDLPDFGKDAAEFSYKT
ncbi:riboflavin kinase [Dendrobium catenatum]|uniref:Riboflavin kinase n=1 Tax=Dendrobium catenatum TaxID=906689 RepID=A0A2I0X2R7_9ASPA|nr:riboflavin kinase [Dendrobium catenatum]